MSGCAKACQFCQAIDDVHYISRVFIHIGKCSGKRTIPNFKDQYKNLFLIILAAHLDMFPVKRY